MIKQLICRHKTRGKKEHHVYDPVIQWLFIPPSRLLNTLLDLQIWWLGYAQTACWTAGHINFMSQTLSPIMVLCLSYTWELSSCSLIQFVQIVCTHFAISVQVHALRVRRLQYERSQA